MARDPYQYCPNCEEKKTWDADVTEGKMYCPDCDYSRNMVAEDL